MGRATSSVTRPPPLASSVPLDPQRPPVVALHQVDAVGGQQRSQQLRDERRIRIDQIRRRRRRPGRRSSRRANATAPRPCPHGRELGHRLLPADDRGARRACPFRRQVGRSGIEDDQLVDQTAEQRVDRVHHRGDGLLLVERGQHHRDGAPSLAPVRVRRCSTTAGPSCSPRPSCEGFAPPPPSCGPPGPPRTHASPRTVRDGARRP